MTARTILKWIRSSLFIIAAVNIGGILEWYEIGLFISWPLIVLNDSDLFDEFLVDSFSMTGVILMVIFALASGGIRGIGGWYFGRKGDKEGRRGAFSLSILLATLPSLLLPLISFFIPYNQWIRWSTITFAIVKFLQGMPAGGEFPGAICFLAESGKLSSHTDTWVGRRYMCTFTVLGPQIGLMLSMIVCLVLKSFSSTTFLLERGWQIVFFISGLLGVFGYLMRKKLHETASFLELKIHNKISLHPLKTLFTKYFSRIVFGFNISVFETILFIVVSLIPLYYAQQPFNLSYTIVIYLSLASTILRSVFLILLGPLLVKFKHFPWLKSSAWGVIPLSFILYLTFAHGNLLLSLLINIAIILLYSIQAAILPSLLAELFPTYIRYTGIAFSFNICDGILLTAITSLCFLIISMNSPLFIFFIPASAIFFIIVLKNKFASEAFYR